MRCQRTGTCSQAKHACHTCVSFKRCVAVLWYVQVEQNLLRIFSPNVPAQDHGLVRTIAGDIPLGVAMVVSAGISVPKGSERQSLHEQPRLFGTAESIADASECLARVSSTHYITFSHGHCCSKF